eukprot:gene57802-biopygen59157
MRTNDTCQPGCRKGHYANQSVKLICTDVVLSGKATTVFDVGSARCLPHACLGGPLPGTDYALLDADIAACSASFTAIGTTLASPVANRSAIRCAMADQSQERLLPGFAHPPAKLDMVCNATDGTFNASCAGSCRPNRCMVPLRADDPELANYDACAQMHTGQTSDAWSHKQSCVPHVTACQQVRCVYLAVPTARNCIHVQQGYKQEHQ